MGELDTHLAAARELDIRPVIGVRARLSTKGAGKWVESTGDRSKFGLTTAEIVAAVERLRGEGMLDCLQLLHFHIGSQITAIRAIKDALREASRIFVELHGAGRQHALPRLRRRPRRRLRRQPDELPLLGQLHAAGVRGRHRQPGGRGLQREGRAASRHRDRVGPRADRAPLGARLQRARLQRDAARARPRSRSRRGRAPRHPAALRDLPGRLAARTSRRPTTTRCSSRRRRSPPSTWACSTCKARARVEQLF